MPASRWVRGLRSIAEPRRLRQRLKRCGLGADKTLHRMVICPIGKLDGRSEKEIGGRIPRGGSNGSEVASKGRLFRDL